MRKFLILMLSVLAVVGCDKPENNDPNNNNNGKNDNKPYMTIKDFPDVIEMYSEMGVQAVCSTSYKNEEIVVSASESWPILRRENNIIYINVPYWGRDNDGNVPAPRSCTVTISAGTFSQTAKLIQESDMAYAGPGLYGKTVMISPIGETIKLPISSNCISWTATTTADWITLKVLDKYNLEITSSAKPDNVTTKRTAEIKVGSSLNTKTSETVRIEESDPNVGPGNYGYGNDHSNWD